LQNWG